MTKRRKFSDQFNAKVALWGVVGRPTLQKIAAKHMVCKQTTVGQRMDMPVTIAYSSAPVRTCNWRFVGHMRGGNSMMWLKAELLRVTEGRDILKKATVYFAEDAK